MAGYDLKSVLARLDAAHRQSFERVWAAYGWPQDIEAAEARIAREANGAKHLLSERASFEAPNAERDAIEEAVDELLKRYGASGPLTQDAEALRLTQTLTLRGAEDLLADYGKALPELNETGRAMGYPFLFGHLLADVMVPRNALHETMLGQIASGAAHVRAQARRHEAGGQNLPDHEAELRQAGFYVGLAEGILGTLEKVGLLVRADAPAGFARAEVLEKAPDDETLRLATAYHLHRLQQHRDAGPVR